MAQKISWSGGGLDRPIVGRDKVFRMSKEPAKGQTTTHGKRQCCVSVENLFSLQVIVKVSKTAHTKLNPQIH